MRFLIVACFLFISLLNVEASIAGCNANKPALADMVAKKSITVSGPFTINALERNHMFEIRETKKKLPFGYANAQWLKFKSSIANEDKIYFITQREDHFYQDGHILVRDGCIIKFLLGSIS